MSSDGPPSTPFDSADRTTDTERAVHGTESVTELHAFLSAYARDRLGSPVAAVRFRAGRIDAVWGVELDDGREVVIKAHRPPADLGAITAARDAQRFLAAADFPCPEPLSGPDEVEGRVLSAEVLLAGGSTPNGFDPGDRRLLAGGLARHIDLLRRLPGLRHRTGPGPSWCRYHDGPWPVPHDPIVDFTTTPAGSEWLDEYARRVTDQMLQQRAGAEIVVGHADWYAGNALVADGALTGSFDWELVADTEAVIAGFTAACYAASSTSGNGLSTPEDVASFLQDYEIARGAHLSAVERRTAAASAAWILAFNARWELALPFGKGADGATITLVRERREDYLDVSW